MVANVQCRNTFFLFQFSVWAGKKQYINNICSGKCSMPQHFFFNFSSLSGMVKDERRAPRPKWKKILKEGTLAF